LLPKFQFVRRGARLQDSTKKLVFTLGAVFGAVLLVLTGLHIFLSMAPYETHNWLARAFDLDEECNVPSWFAAVAWFSAGLSAVLAYIAERQVKLKAPGRAVWLLIGLVFLIASVDEVVSLHEHTGVIAKRHFESTGSFAAQLTEQVPDSPWLVLYVVPILVVLGLILLFINARTKSLASRRAVLALVLGAVAAYGTALNCELYQSLPMWQCQAIAAWLKVDVDWLIAVTVVCEEFLETLGTILIVCAFAAYVHELAASFFASFGLGE
jgi:hypothetical protein